MSKELIQIESYQPQYKEDFKTLNLEWIQKYFKVEPHDVEQLENPEKYILESGGQIFFALYQNQVVGTVALVKNSDTDYEMAKMAVNPQYQGIGAGKVLCAHTIQAAKDLGASVLWLVSSTQLTPALTMYRKLGFVEVPIGETEYSRADIKMEIVF